MLDFCMGQVDSIGLLQLCHADTIYFGLVMSWGHSGFEIVSCRCILGFRELCHVDTSVFVWQMCHWDFCICVRWHWYSGVEMVPGGQSLVLLCQSSLYHMQNGLSYAYYRFHYIDCNAEKLLNYCNEDDVWWHILALLIIKPFALPIVWVITWRVVFLPSVLQESMGLAARYGVTANEL